MGMIGEGKAKRKRKRDRIPIDLIVEILLRLPARSVARFRVACKLWQSTTLDPQFIDAHLRRAPTSFLLTSNIYLFGAEESGYASRGLEEDYSFTVLEEKQDQVWTPNRRFWLRPNRGEKITFHGSCNGIICTWNHDDNDSIQLLNPATGNSLTLPRNPNSDLCQRLFFGFHPITNEYKVIFLYEGDHPYDPRTHLYIQRCQVYTVGGGGTDHRRSWSRLGGGGTDHRHSWRDVPTTIPGFYPSYPATFVNGVMYFVSVRDKISTGTFDLKQETFKEFPITGLDIPVESCTDIRIAELRGSVCMSLKFLQRMDIRRLNTEQGTWTPMYSISPWAGIAPINALCTHQGKILTTSLLSSGIDNMYIGLDYTHTRINADTILCYRYVDKDNVGLSKILYAHNSGYDLHVHVESLVELPNQ